jgi:hypothetical protein
VLGGKIYVMGGEAAHHQFLDQRAEVQVYDPVTNSWSQLASMPLAKSHAEASTFVLNGKIVFAGGQTNYYEPTDNVIAYDPAADGWVTLPPLPAPRQGVVVQAVGTKIVVALGATDTYTPQNVTWVGELPGSEESSNSPSTAASIVDLAAPAPHKP